MLPSLNGKTCRAFCPRLLVGVVAMSVVGVFCSLFMICCPSQRFRLEWICGCSTLWVTSDCQFVQAVSTPMGNWRHSRGRRSNGQYFLLTLQLTRKSPQKCEGKEMKQRWKMVAGLQDVSFPLSYHTVCFQIEWTGN